MKNLNQDIQASYQIISLLEKSKTNSEVILDQLPDLFFVVDEVGNILKANIQVAHLLKLNEENLLGINISRLFLDQTWNVFNTHLKQAKLLSALNKPVEFELPVDGREGHERICYWTIAPLVGEIIDNHNLYCLIGRDITLLRAYQKQLAEIFASIPLGILTVNIEGRTESAFSTYTQWLLDNDKIANISIKDLLYNPSQEFMDSIAREGWQNLLNFANLTPKEFDMLAETFPQQFYYPLKKKKNEESDGRYLGIKVQSIVQNKKIAGLLIILEDRTLLVQTEKADEKKNLLENLSLDRALQIKKCDPDLLDITLEDLGTLFVTLGDNLFLKDLDQFLGTLHTIKGNSRLGGFTFLLKLTHELESKIKTMPQNDFSWKDIYSDVDELRHEWREISSLAKVLSTKEIPETNATDATHNSQQSSPSIYQMVNELIKSKTQPTEQLINNLLKKAQELSYKEVHSLENPIRVIAQKTAQSIGKKVKVVFEWEPDLKIDESFLFDYRSCLMHLITNAIDHGIETPEKRIELLKPLSGTVKINIYFAGERLVAVIDDDGQGLNYQKILVKAIEKKLITPEQAKKLNEDELSQLIFSSGFSTTDVTTEHSGRGVGLSAVADIVKQRGGEITVSKSKFGGTHFQFYFKTGMK